MAILVQWSRCNGTAPGATNSDPAWCAGVMVTTAFGPRPIETLRAGDLVMTRCGGIDTAMPVRWIGERTVAIDRHPDPDSVAPIRILRDALAPGMPRQDLMLSPDHAILAQNRLVRVRQLVNGTSIRREPPPTARYLHVELRHHALMLVDNLPCESFLDTGNRRQYGNNAGPVTLHADFTRAEHADACLTLAEAPHLLRPVRRGLADRAAQLGLLPRTADGTAEPELGLGLGLPCGRVLAPERRIGNSVRFWLDGASAGCMPVRLRSFAPAATAPPPADRRRLGICVSALLAWTRPGGLQPESLPLGPAATADGAGWRHRDGGRRWTDGNAGLLLPAATLLLEVTLGHEPARQCRPDAAARHRCAKSAEPARMPD